jgi:hypothetical protein
LSSTSCVASTSRTSSSTPVSSHPVGWYDRERAAWVGTEDAHHANCRGSRVALSN